MNRRFIVAVLVVIIIVGVISAVFAQRQGTQSGLVVTASFYAMAEFARQVGGNRVHVINLTPVGVEPHDFEPSPQDLVSIEKSKVFVYTGAGFEPWASRIVSDLKDVTVINASEGIGLLPVTPIEGETRGGSKTDPHFYLDPVLDQKVVRTIAAKLAEVDPSNRAYYQKNAVAYVKKLGALDKEYRSGLLICNNRDFITSHAAFAYIAKRYNLVQIPIAGLSEEEPSPAKLAEIAKLAREHHVKYIFVEKLVSPRLADTIAQEIGAKTLVLDPIEGLTPDEQKAGKNFISLMKDNLANLRLALECK